MERGGLNLYAFVDNAAGNSVDFFGLDNPIPKMCTPQYKFVCDVYYWQAAGYADAKSCTVAELANHIKDDPITPGVIHVGAVCGPKPFRIAGAIADVCVVIVFDSLCNSCASGHYEVVPGATVVGY
jgi:hypothetical protein